VGHKGIPKGGLGVVGCQAMKGGERREDAAENAGSKKKKVTVFKGDEAGRGKHQLYESRRKTRAPNAGHKRHAGAVREVI